MSERSGLVGPDSSKEDRYKIEEAGVAAGSTRGMAGNVVDNDDDDDDNYYSKPHRRGGAWGAHCSHESQVVYIPAATFAVLILLLLHVWAVHNFMYGKNLGVPDEDHISFVPLSEQISAVDCADVAPVKGKLAPGSSDVDLGSGSADMASGGRGAASGSGDEVEEAVRERAKTIQEAWVDVYSLTESNAADVHVDLSRLSPRSRTSRPIPAAPHLELCQELADQRQLSEKRGPKLALPPWASSKARGGALLPWVQGSDADNLAFTRAAQADIWRQQFPKDCSDPKLRFVRHVIIPSAANVDIAMQLHVMSAAFALAYASDRIFVPVADSFDRADHAGCKGPHKASLSCYFFPITSPECEARVEALQRKSPAAVLSWGATESNRKDYLKQLKGDAAVVQLTRALLTVPGLGAKEFAPSNWTDAWDLSSFNNFIFGRLTAGPAPQVSWWRAQSIRFMLRWPTKYLCHIINQQRHVAYGAQVALDMAMMEAQEDALREALSEESRSTTGFVRPLFLGLKAQRMLPFNSSSLLTRPFIYRPIASVHVSDATSASDVVLKAHLLQLSWMQPTAPAVAAVWMSSDSKVDVVSTTFKPNIYYATVKAKSGSRRAAVVQQENGGEDATGADLASLLIAAESDFFVGNLSSHWARLINELRLTGGKVNSGYMSIDIDEY